MEENNDKLKEKELLQKEKLTQQSESEKENTFKEEEKIKEDINKENEVKIEENNTKAEENKINNIEEKTENNKDKKSKKIIVLAIFIIFILFISTIFAILNINNEGIINGTYIEQVNVEGKNKEEVNNLINDKISSITDISLTSKEYDDVVKLEDLGIEINAKEAIQKAINLGRTNNIIIDNYQIICTKLLKKQLELTITFNEDKFNEMIKNIQVEMPEALKEYSYEVKDDKLIITNGISGKVIDIEEFRKLIIKNIKDQFNNENIENIENIKKIEIPTKEANPSEIDIEEIYNEIHKDAKDAYIEEDPFELHKEEEGIDFKISIEEAKEILKEDKETYKIPLKITKPKVKVEDLGEKLFKQTLSKYTTIYDAGNTNRASNIALAAKTINGTVLLPGETFSYNSKLGNTTKEKGYKEGGAYVGGKVVQAYGGGICQVSTTLYNAVLYANLDIIERYNHSYSVNYVPSGRDATVSYGGKDFKFKNTRKYPIKIVANAKNGVVSMTIKGIKEEKEYEIVLTSNVLSTIPCTTKYEKDSSLEEGKEKVIQKGHSGQKSITYKIVKYKGKTISKTVLSKDTYKPMDRIIQSGTKKSSNKQTETVQANTKPEKKKKNNSIKNETNTTDTDNNTNV